MEKSSGSSCLCGNSAGKAGEGGGGRTVKLEPDIDGLHSNLSEVVCLLRGAVSL